MDKMKDVALLVGRVLLALMFVMAGWARSAVTPVPRVTWKPWACPGSCCPW